MTRLVPDPLQPFDHLGNPEDGPERFIKVNDDPNYVSPELERQLARKREEQGAKDELAHYAHLYTIRRPHRAKLACPRCTRDYYEVGRSNGRCAVCIVELQHRPSFHAAIEDIAP